MSDYAETDAHRIADRGRDALLERLRPAFDETARQHADILELKDGQLESMIQRAADQADGLQWRRALARVATEQLGLSLGEALTAPVVARAHELAGAPSYEAALAALGLEPARSEPENGELPALTEPADVRVAELPTLHLRATHLGGIAGLEAGEDDLELRIGSDGLDIARQPDELLGRLRWREIRTLAVDTPRGRRLRRGQDRAQLVIRTRHGDASFEIPAATDSELQARLAPLLERYARP